MFGLLRSMLVLLLVYSVGAPAATTTVTTISDADSPTDGQCSLREAIITINNGAPHNECIPAGTGPSRIRFQIPGAAEDIQTITLLGAALPIIQQAVEIDGTTQGSAKCVGALG